MSRFTDSLRAGMMRRTLPGFEPGDRHVEVIPITTPMSDGTVLHGDLLMPDRVEEGAPTIVVRTPYGRGGPLRAQLPLPLASHGFPVVVQSCRGRDGSGGTFVPQVHEQSDGIDTLRWVRAQPWFTGRLATAGMSYLGYTQWAVAGRLSVEEPETASEALSLAVTMPDFGAITWDNGAFSLRNALGWTRLISLLEKPAAMLLLMLPSPRLARGLDTIPLSEGDVVAIGHHNDWYQDWVHHEDLTDEYWTQQSHTASVPQVTAPILMHTGWQDIFLPWQIRTYQALVEAGRPPQLTIGPWQHATPAGTAVWLTDTVAFFAERFLGKASARRAPVRFHLGGIDEWQDSASWPPPGTADSTWHLRAGGILDPEAPADSESPATGWVYDPADPTPSTGGPLLEPAPVAAVDDAPHELRADVVTFTSEPLPADLDVTGTPTATVWLRSDRPSVDVFVRITDVHPDGRSMSVCDAIRRVGSPATSATDPAPSADGAWPVALELWPTAHRFLAGHRLRVQISSGAHPRYARNTGTGLPAADDAELHAAHQEVLHEPVRSSSVTLPVWQR